MIKARFEFALKELTKPDPKERKTITKVVNELKSPPYNLELPTMWFRDTAL